MQYRNTVFRVAAQALPICILALTLLFSAAGTAFGEPQGTETGGNVNQNGGNANPSNGGNVNPGQTGQTQTIGLVNPLKESTIEGFLISIIDVLLIFATPVIIYFIMYGGFKLVTARGDTSQIEEGRNAITWAVVGGVIVLGAKLIITVIKGTISAFGS